MRPGDELIAGIGARQRNLARSRDQAGFALTYGIRVHAKPRAKSQVGAIGNGSCASPDDLLRGPIDHDPVDRRVPEAAGTRETRLQFSARNGKTGREQSLGPGEIFGAARFEAEARRALVASRE
jgi:hypothetical protein